MTTIRAATPEDAWGIATVRVRAWQAGYAHLLPADYLAGLDVAENAARWRGWLGLRDADTRVLVAADGDEVIGFVAARSGVDGLEVNTLYVDPGQWRRGIASELLQAVLDGPGEPDQTVFVWTFEGAAAARACYRRNGFRADGGRRIQTFGDTDSWTVRYVRTRALPAPPPGPPG